MKSGLRGPRVLKSADMAEAIQDSRERLGLSQAFDLGVLLVHGMGEQKRRATLDTDGGEILEWLRKRVETAGADGAGMVEILDEVQRGVAAGDGDLPAHVIVRITPPPGAGAPAYWLIAEGWWAESFPPADYEEFAPWARAAGPLVGATVIADIARRLEVGKDVNPWLRLLLIPVRFPIGLAMVAIGALAAFAVSLYGLVLGRAAKMTSLPFVARWALSKQRTLAAGQGDAYLFATRPEYSKAMADKVRSDLAAVREQSMVVAIVAHSMGTGVSWEALTTSRSPAAIHPVRLFVTYGQGLRKLFFTREAATSLPQLASTVGAISQLGALAIVALALIGVTLLARPFLPDALAAILAIVLGPAAIVAMISGVLAVVLEVELLRSCRRIWVQSGQNIEKDWSKVREVAPELKWLDLWASSDPASVGPLSVVGERIDSYKIRNRAWPPVDHDVYWMNHTEYLPIVLSCLFELGGPTLYAAALDDPRLAVTAMRRHTRVHWLVTTRVFLAGAAGGGLVVAVVGAGLPLWIPLVAAAVLLKLGVRPWRWLDAGWSSLVTADETTYFRGVRLPLWSAAWWLFGALAALLAILPAVLLLLLGREPLGAVYLIAVAFTALLALTVLSGGGSTFGRREQKETLRLAMRGAPGGAPVVIVVTAAAITVLVLALVLAALAAPGLFGTVLLLEVGIVLLAMAAEGIREYWRFRTEFAERSAKLPPPPASRRP